VLLGNDQKQSPQRTIETDLHERSINTGQLQAARQIKYASNFYPIAVMCWASLYLLDQLAAKSIG
jgi:hypothetical protein